VNNGYEIECVNPITNYICSGNYSGSPSPSISTTLTETVTVSSDVNDNWKIMARVCAPLGFVFTAIGLYMA